MDYFGKARDLLRGFKGDAYLFGNHVLKDAGGVVASCGKKAALVRGGFPGVESHIETIRRSLAQAGVSLAAEITGAKPNAPREDVFRITAQLKQVNPDVIVSFGGGSTIDAVKAAEVIRALGGELDDYFGVGVVAKRLQATGGKLTPHVAIQSAAGSGAHLTKYSNITDIQTGQKKLIVDDAIIPTRAMFDYTVTRQAPPALTADGAMDGLAHILEVFYGAVGKPHYGKLQEIAEVGIPLIINHLSCAMGIADCRLRIADSSRGANPKSEIQNPKSATAREALCLATDLGAYAIMLGGTNGAHLTSFSLVDILSHGRACALMNPYYTVFFAPAIEEPLGTVGALFRDAGYIRQDLKSLHGRDLGVAVANGMFAFAKAIDFPTQLSEVEGFTQAHIDRVMAAAKNPQLKMKIENMPIPLTAAMIDEYMAPLLQAAATGDLTLIKNV
jgi:alcohol dehydrogenase class IV